MSKFIAFLVTAFLAWLISLGITVLLTEIAGLNYLLGYTLGLSAAVLYGYLVQAKIIFKSETSHRTLGKYLLVLLTVNLLNILLVGFCVEWFGVHYVLAIITVTFFTLSAKFLIYKLWVFKKGPLSSTG